MDPQELIKIIQALDQLVETATKETVNNRDFDGQKLLDFIGEDISDYWDTLPREDGLLVYGPYDLEELVGAGRGDLNLVIDALTDEAEDIITGFRLQIMDQSSQSVGGPNTFRPEIDEIFILDLGEFSTKEEMENLFTKTTDIDGATAKVSLVGDKLDEIFPNSTASIEMALTNKGPVISDRLRKDIDRNFIPPYAQAAFEKVDAEQAAQYAELTGDVEVPDTAGQLFSDPASENLTGAMESLSAALPEDLSDVDLSDEDKAMIENFRKTKKEFEAITKPVSSLEDDVAEVTNDFVYNKFAEKQNTADNVIFRELDDGTVELLVIKRKRGPHRSLFALPGGIVNYEMTNEQIIKGVVDPFTFPSMDYHKTVGDVPITPGSLKSYNGDEIFAEEAIREGLEEVNLNKKFIKNSFILPLKYNRLDWDARAAQGVNVGGVGMVVSNEWVPKAGDDALSYEWITLDDVISGEKQLAFGHVEFVEDSLRIVLKNNLLTKSNQDTIYNGETKYSYNDLADLQEQVIESKKRNTEIIIEANKVRAANGQPEIPISNNNIVDRQNQALINSIRGISSQETFTGEGRVRITPQMQMDPNYIFHDVFQFLTKTAPQSLVFSQKEILTTVDNAPPFADDPDLIYQEIELKPEAKNKAKIQLRDIVLKRYKSELQKKINEGMHIGPYIVSMYQNVENIVNSKEFDIVLDELIDNGLQGSYGSSADDTGFLKMYNITGFQDNELSQLVGLDNENTNIQKNGIKETVDENIQYLIDNNYKSGQALKNIQLTNETFFKNTFPEEIYEPTWEYWQKNSTKMPEAILETKQATLTNDGRIKGMVYHGSPSLNERGRTIAKILDKHIYKNTNLVNVTEQLSVRNVINPIAFEDNLNWLDPTNYRSQMLRLNYMYTTNNPFLASTYSMGGMTMGVEKMQAIAKDTFIKILNQDDVKNDTSLIAKIDKDLKKIGLTIKQKDNIEKTLEILPIKETEFPPLFADPAISQIEFNAPGDSLLHTDMPLARQVNNDKIRNLLVNVVNNSSPTELFVDSQIQRRLIDNLRREISKTGSALTERMTNAEYKLLKYLLDGANFSVDRLQDGNEVIDVNKQLFKDGDEARKTLINFFADNLSNSQNNIRDLIKEGLEKGNLRFNDIHYIIRDQLYGNESITNEARKEAFDWVVATTGNTNSGFKYFYDNKNTIGELLFTKLLDENTPNIAGQKISRESILQFASTLDPARLGGSYQATHDLLYIKYFFENMEYGSPLYNDVIDNINTRTLAPSKWQQGDRGVHLSDNESLLRDLVHDLQQYFKEHETRIKTKFNEDVSDFVNLNLDNEVFAVQNKVLNKIEGNQDLINFLRKVMGISNRYISPFGNSYAAADILQLKALSQSGIEIVVGTGGGRVGAGNEFHDVFMIVDPGDKFETGVPREVEYKVKGVELDQEKIKILNDIKSGIKSFADLDDNSIKAIAELIPLEVILENENLSIETKEKYSALYNDLQINDRRYLNVDQLNPTPIDGAFLQQFDEVKELIAQQAMFGNVSDEEIQREIRKALEMLDGQIPKELQGQFLKSSGLLRTLANGVDIFDALVVGPALIDLFMSSRSGVGSATETIGGAVADVAENIYDPDKDDTFFENLYGSPADMTEMDISLLGKTITVDNPQSPAAHASSVISNVVDYIINPLYEGAKSNKIINSMIESIKDGAISALRNVRDAAGMNDWIYDVKRDMFVTAALKERGFTGDRPIPPGLVRSLENEYESYVPKEVDKYGKPLDVSDPVLNNSRYVASNNRTGGGGSGTTVQ